MADSFDEMRRKVEAWVRTPEGQALMEATARAAREAAKQVARDARVNPEYLCQPMTI